MVAVAPLSPWTAKDDFLFINALEAGASLESLAKGAVEFSRKFTIRELRDRWNSVLFDVDASTESSMQILEFKRSQVKRTSKSKRAGNSKSKENDCSLGKKKSESIRKCYYALRKKMCCESLSMGNLSLLGDSYNINGSEVPCVNNIRQDPMENHFGLQDNSLNDSHVFPQVMRNNALLCGVGEFPNGLPSRLEDSIKKNSVKEKIPLENSMATADNCEGQMDPSEELPEGHVIFQSTEANFVGNTMLNSPAPHCASSFNHLQYTCTPPEMSDWKTIEGISEQGIPDDANVTGNNVLIGEQSSIPYDVGPGKGKSEYNFAHMEHNQMSCDDMKNSTDGTDGYFLELADTLFDFTNEDILEDDIDKSYLDDLSSLLLNSPYDAAADKVSELPDTKEADVPVAYYDIVNPGPEDKNSAGDGHLCEIHECNSENQAPTIAPQSTENFDGFMCCTLNTEDPEVPNNDHVVFPRRPKSASSRRRTQNEDNILALPDKNNNSNEVSEKDVCTVERKPKRFRESNPASQVQDPKIQLNHTLDDFGVKFEMPRVEWLNDCENPTITNEVPSHSGLAIEKESSELSLVRQSGSGVGYKPCHVSNSGHPQSGSGELNKEGRAMLSGTDQGCYAAGFKAAEHGGEPVLSDQSEEQFSDSDSDIPYFSDVESMILDRDLVPDDQDSFSGKEVAKYLHEGGKREILKLEQNAHSYMKRALAFHGAFAILYDRHWKHYIKKPEVLLGRGTDDVPVDIKLGEECCAKISRREAIIKMDTDGAFYVKNLGRHLIYVNEKEISRGQFLRLLSNCYIEIRGMSFVFETDEKYVKKCLSNGARKDDAKAPGVL